MRSGGAGRAGAAPPVRMVRRFLRAAAVLARCGSRRLVRRWPLGARFQRGTERGSLHGVTDRARCGLEARGGLAPRLPSAGCGASCAAAVGAVRDSPSGAASTAGARFQRGTERGSSHGVTERARCGREARGGLAPRLRPLDAALLALQPSSRCGIRRVVRRWPLGARFQRGTVRASSHGVTERARCGREARGGRAPRLPSAGCGAACALRQSSHGAGLAVWCGVDRWVRAFSAARCGQARTG